MVFNDGSRIWTTTVVISVLCLWQVLALPSSYSGSRDAVEKRDGGYDLPIQVRSIPRKLSRRGEVSGSIGLGNNADLLYTVPMRIGNTVAPLHIDTGSSDLWIASDRCTTNACANSPIPRYPRSSMRSTQTDVQMFYGDSTTGTFAFGEVALDTATIAGVAMVDQPFGVVNDTDNPVVMFGTSGIFGLGFPSGSKVQSALTNTRTGSLFPTDDLIAATYTDGPLLSRISMTGELQMPMFTVTLQRSTIDIEGEGLLTIGRLPPGIDNSTLTWVPIRLYNATEGGMRPPNFAPNEVYPFRWEIDIDGVYLNGRRLPDSTIPARNGMDSRRNSALLDTGNSILRGPEDVVNNILTTVSPNFDPDNANSLPSFPCQIPQTLAFEIGGKMFPIDPRDFIGQIEPNNARDCVADNLVSTDAPTISALYRWSLGAPFFRSNLVAFHYGNLTHPSVDPPRIGILSNVPDNANELLLQAVRDARNNGGNFEQTLELPPTGHVETEVPRTVTRIPPSATSETTYTLALSATDIGNGGRVPQATGGPTTGSENSGASSISNFVDSQRTLFSFVVLLALWSL
ncbi:hypothetical protein CC1G_08025 [Coprinopsis cinerea okayama7|uniref:Peptidase A1 domain-containing protein n=1 Tax=Coprinopsis cinerea (strain Okayama-7 / 130 / ATCC MYA-4618 / FGSC 9003) TaxID=240176 RepID=A8NQA9_COPC7|nr:hypothetical protein CC1G_08025 [Coprinopsis cinerea okayama7\|eukprot:XP_001835516.1 hypothetical protein CC1G_08025 [Coprinopsis cinerea okayama7\